MKKLFCVMLALTGVLWLNAAAQPEAGGHNHAANKNKKTAREIKLDSLWHQSDQAYDVGNYQGAIGFHKQIVALDPHDVESFGVAAWLMWSLGQNKEAIAHIERGLKANKVDWQMWATAGQQYDLQKKAMPVLAAQAKTAYLRAVELLPKNADKREAQMLRRSLAHAAQKADDIELSVATWRKLVADYPNDDVNKNNLRRVEKLLAEKKKAVPPPVIIGAVGIATIALLGRVLRSRNLRATSQSKAASSFIV